MIIDPTIVQRSKSWKSSIFEVRWLKYCTDNILYKNDKVKHANM